MLGIKFHSAPVYNVKCIKTKVKEFNGVVTTKFWGDEVPKEGMHYTCIACMSVAQVYLEECKYKIKKEKKPGFIDVELELDYGSDSE